MYGSPSSRGASPQDGSPDAIRGEVTELLQAWSRGDAAAFERMMPLVYERLLQIASGMLTYERRDHTLQSGALVNEAYLRLVHLERVSWSDRAHFFALSATLMRRILVDHARKVKSEKRGQGADFLPLEAALEVAGEKRPDILCLDLALKDLARKAPEEAKIVEMRYFGGLSRDEIAEVLGVGSATVTRRWRMARAWLYQQLNEVPQDAV